MLARVHIPQVPERLALKRQAQRKEKAEPPPPPIPDRDPVEPECSLGNSFHIQDLI